MWQTLVPSNMKAQIIQAFHTSTRNAHYGDLKTFTQIREHYTWNGMFSDVREFVQQCEICSRFGARPVKAKRKYHIRSDEPGEHWVINMVHLPKAKSGHQWLLTMIDVCSRWAAIARPMADMGHKEVAQTVMEEWAHVGVHIHPQRVTHDGGNEFKSRFEDMCHVLQKERHVSISDRPEGHGIIERFNRDVMQLIAGQNVPIRPQ